MTVKPSAIVALAAALLLAGPSAGASRGADVRRTRADLDAQRRITARLESELALSSTRKPYLVLDLATNMLRYRLLGMTVREIPLAGVKVHGLQPAGDGGAEERPSLAGIFTIAEKEGDPRLKPLTSEQVEAGADDENAADALPPEPPKSYRLKFKQPVEVRVAAEEQKAGWGTFRNLWGRLFGAGHGVEARLSVAVRLDAGTSAELYRSLIPELRWLVIPPDGFVLPAAGQEAPPQPKPAKKEPVRPPKPIEPPGVPFQIPPPEGEVPKAGEDAEEAQPAPESPPAQAPGEEPPPPEPPPPPPPS